MAGEDQREVGLERRTVNKDARQSDSTRQGVSQERNTHRGLARDEALRDKEVVRREEVMHAAIALGSCNTF